MREFFASAVVHVSMAVVGTIALAGTARESRNAAAPVMILDIDRADPVASPEAARELPRPIVTPEAAANPSPARARTAVRPTTAAREGGQPGEDLPVAVVAAASSAPPRFVMAFGTAAPAAGGRSVAAGTGATQGGDDAQTYPENGVSSQARLLEGTPPEYPPAARAAAVEANLPLEIVVDASGAVIDARLLGHAGYGLDEAALRAIRAYRFAPAQRAGHGVSVRMRWVVDFRLD